ncbi:hypothetical protein [Parabacteroides sp.]
MTWHIENSCLWDGKGMPVGLQTDACRFADGCLSAGKAIVACEKAGSLLSERCIPFPG